MDNLRGVFLRSPFPVGIELERICRPPIEAIDSSLGGSKDAIDDTRGSIPAEQRRSVINLIIRNFDSQNPLKITYPNRLVNEIQLAPHPTVWNCIVECPPRMCC